MGDRKCCCDGARMCEPVLFPRRGDAFTLNQRDAQFGFQVAIPGGRQMKQRANGRDAHFPPENPNRGKRGPTKLAYGNIIHSNKRHVFRHLNTMFGKRAHAADGDDVVARKNAVGSGRF